MYLSSHDVRCDIWRLRNAQFHPFFFFSSSSSSQHCWPTTSSQCPMAPQILTSGCSNKQTLINEGAHASVESRTSFGAIERQRRQPDEDASKSSNWADMSECWPRTRARTPTQACSRVRWREKDHREKPYNVCMM